MEASCLLVPDRWRPVLPVYYAFVERGDAPLRRLVDVRKETPGAGELAPNGGSAKDDCRARQFLAMTTVTIYTGLLSTRYEFNTAPVIARAVDGGEFIVPLEQRRWPNDLPAGRKGSRRTIFDVGYWRSTARSKS